MRRALPAGGHRRWRRCVKYSEIETVFLAPADARAAFERGAVDAWVIWDPFQAAAEKTLEARALADGTGPRRWLVALGYAGWGEGQLDEEMTRHGWFNVPGDLGLLYDVDVAARWHGGFISAGIDPAQLASAAGHA
eukprot:gene4605-6287_t